MIISNLSFGIYLIHPLMMDLIFKFKVTLVVEKLNPIINIPILDLIVFCLSFVVLKIFKSIPYIKRIIG